MGSADALGNMKGREAPARELPSKLYRLRQPIFLVVLLGAIQAASLPREDASTETTVKPSVQPS